MAQFWLQVTSAADMDLFTLDAWDASGRFTFNPANPDLGRPDLLRLGESSSTNSADRVLVTYDPAGSVADAEVRVYGVYSGISAAGGGPCVRASSRLSHYYYRNRRSVSGDTQLLMKQSGTTETQLVAGRIVPQEAVWHWSALRVDGNRLRGAAWHGGPGDADLIPAWQFDEIDSEHAAPAPVGVFARPRPAFMFHIIAIGTDGDSAPTGPVGAGSRRRRSPLLLTPW